MTPEDKQRCHTAWNAVRDLLLIQVPPKKQEVLDTLVPYILKDLRQIGSVLGVALLSDTESDAQETKGGS